MGPDSLYFAVEIVRENADGGYWEGFLSFLEIAAWPITIIIIAVLFQSRIKDLIGGIESIKHGDTELRINRDLTEAESEVQDANIHSSVLSGVNL